ncbi:bifunctional protein GlmU-like [Mya arenaria]|uniref:bifunctional protein GlmU-like n=1 Tax=Mya arenaria TaxID=6604 RepID=UPI0022E05D2E|nr:bifunctional protein GlmU-like [Mya arenaria]XP_052766019.1 bifunctional protein GlmU-like [Mya arenaria]XP_052766021.1 bifunctional protein GlmU-like [Mya arenaria]XP_052766022.1 bifunctional protein GlmU-like [Mya arenaria]
MDEKGSDRTSSSCSLLKTYALRLKPGDEITSSMQSFIEANQLEAAFVLTCVGSVTEMTLRMADSVTIKRYNGPFEIVSLVGTVSAGGHLHGSFSDKEGVVIGGHVVGGMKVYTTAEVVIGECSGYTFTREPCGMSGYNELVVNKK